MESIRNRVDESGLIQLDLASLLPAEIPLAFDLADQLWEGLILKEKPFRVFLQSLSPETYKGRDVALFCSANAVIPDWAWMLASSALIRSGANVWSGTPTQARESMLHTAIESLEVSDFEDGRVVIKGCSDVGGSDALSRIISKLQPVAAAIMYGEPCSTVPIYKRPKA